MGVDGAEVIDLRGTDGSFAEGDADSDRVKAVVHTGETERQPECEVVVAFLLLLATSPTILLPRCLRVYR